MQAEKISMTLSSDCDCWVIDGKDNEVAATECSGDCWIEQVEWFIATIIEQWKNRNGWDFDTPIKILGKNLTWQHLTGHAKTTVIKVLDSLTVGGDFTLRFELEGKELSCVRSSHDEHSASFTFVYDKDGE